MPSLQLRHSQAMPLTRCLQLDRARLSVRVASEDEGISVLTSLGCLEADRLCNMSVVLGIATLCIMRPVTSLATLS